MQFLSVTMLCLNLFLPNIDQFPNSQWQKDYQKLRLEIQNGETFVKHLSISANEILAIDGAIGGYGDNGTTPGGVFLIKTTMGLKALKFSPKDWHEPSGMSQGMTNLQRDEIIIQNFFANYGLSPSVTGTLSSNEVIRLIKQFPELKSLIRLYSSHSGSWTAFLTEYIPEAYNPKKYGSSFEVSAPPAFAKSWDFDKLRAQVSLIAKARDNLKMHLMDPQILITKNGRALAIDFGYETVLNRDDVLGAHFSPPNYVTATANRYQDIINMIERAVREP